MPIQLTKCNETHRITPRLQQEDAYQSIAIFLRSLLHQYLQSEKPYPSRLTGVLSQLNTLLHTFPLPQSMLICIDDGIWETLRHLPPSPSYLYKELLDYRIVWKINTLSSIGSLFKGSRITHNNASFII